MGTHYGLKCEKCDVGESWFLRGANIVYTAVKLWPAIKIIRQDETGYFSVAVLGQCEQEDCFQFLQEHYDHESLVLYDEYGSSYPGELPSVETITKAQLNNVYKERNMCISLLVKMALALGLRAGIGKHLEDGIEWDQEWLNIAFIDLPSGQVSWHLHQDDMVNFEGVPNYTSEWDGHSTDEKYVRVINAQFEESSEHER